MIANRVKHSLALYGLVALLCIGACIGAYRAASAASARVARDATATVSVTAE